tara:strand:+ start:403 stop:699 length:297 start_codon:yes stop_codon:yes gene_type:complete
MKMNNLNIANKDGFRFGEQAYIIGHEFGTICISYANNEQDALDHAVDEGFMGSELMSSEDFQEYSAKGWDDSYIQAGSASEALWFEYLYINLAKNRKS